MTQQTKGIVEMARGAALERIDYEMNRVVENILDENTKPDTKRVITLKITLAPDSQRENIVVSYEASSKLAPTNPVVTSLYVAGEDSNGLLQVVELTPQIPGQINLYGGEQEAAAILRVLK